MRVLLVTHYYPGHGGGIEVVAGELACRMAGRGVSVHWAASAPITHPLGIGIVPLPMYTWNAAGRVAGFAFPVWSPHSLTRLWAAVQSCDLVHLHEAFYPSSLCAYLFARLSGKPVVVTQHMGQIPAHIGMPTSLRIARYLLAILYRLLGRAVLGGCACCVFISPKVRNYFARLAKFKRTAEYIPNGLDHEVFYPVDQAARLCARAGLGWPADRPVLLFVGRFIDRKGLPLLRYLAEVNPGWDWVFVGRGPLTPTTWGLPNVYCPGSVPHPVLADYYRAADILILPSVVEGFPLVVQEAMACGTPVLVSDEVLEGCPAAEEVVVSCQPTRDLFGARLRELVNKKNLEGQRAAVAKFARKHWDWEKCTDRYIQVYLITLGVASN